MRIKTITAAALALPLALSAVAAGDAPDGCYVAIEGDETTADDDVVACQLDTWLHGSTTKASNLSDVGAQPVVGWDTNAPTGSVSGGAGAGSAGVGAGRTAGDDTGSALHISDTFTGPIDVMDFTLHAIAPTGIAYTLDDLSVSVTIDGVAVHSADTQLITAKAIPAPNSALPAGTMQFDFALTNIATYMKLAGIDLTADAEHTVEVIARGWFVDSGNWAWVYDTTEVPSGISFNPLTIDPKASLHPVY